MQVYFKSQMDYFVYSPLNIFLKGLNLLKTGEYH